MSSVTDDRVTGRVNVDNDPLSCHVPAPPSPEVRWYASHSTDLNTLTAMNNTDTWKYLHPVIPAVKQ